MIRDTGTVELVFSLVEEDGWPPVSTECVPCIRTGDHFRVLVAPLFVQGVSAGDVIAPDLDAARHVVTWQSVERSRRSTVWLLRLAQCADRQIDCALKALRALGCNTSGIEALGAYAIDVPDTLSIRAVDECLEGLDSERVAVAFPSMRHDEAAASTA